MRLMPEYLKDLFEYDRRKNIGISIISIQESMRKYYPWFHKKLQDDPMFCEWHQGVTAHVDYHSQAINIGTTSLHQPAPDWRDLSDKGIWITLWDYYHDLDIVVNVIVHETIHLLLYAMDKRIGWIASSNLDRVDGGWNEFFISSYKEE